MGGTGKIFIVDPLHGFTEAEQRPYPAEDDLQALLVEHPDLLPGDQIDPDRPRRWLLVRREIPIADEPDGADRWYLDHLFLDQDGIPTLVECKRTSDPRARREVVAQMLDYAANATVHWPIATLQAAAEDTAQQAGRDLGKDLTRLLGTEEPERVRAFWEAVERNLQAGRIRLLFVGDSIRRELRQIVEFLNAQMAPAEVLAVELKQFLGGSVKALVPQVIGATEAARVRKGGSRPESPRRRWTEAEFMQDLQARNLPTAQVNLLMAFVRLAQKLGDAHVAQPAWGHGRSSGSLSVTQGGSNLLSAYSFGAIYANMVYWQMGAEENGKAAEQLGRVLGRELTYSENRSPNITEDLVKADPELQRLEAWIRELAPMAGRDQEEDQ